MNSVVNPRNQVKAALQSEVFQQNLKASLPPSVSVDRFTATAMTAISNNAALLDADRQSLYSAIVRAAQDGLQPDGREGVLNVYNTKVNNEYVKKVQWLPMAYGLTKKLAKVGIRLETAIVCENDDFEYQQGDEPKIVHKVPNLSKPRGEIVGAYAIATFSDGRKQREVMTRDQIELVRAQSRSKDGPGWGTWFDMMARKSVGKRLANRIGIEDEDISDFLKRDNAEDAPEAETDPEFQAASAQPAPIKPPANRPKGLQSVIDHDAGPPPDDVVDEDDNDPFGPQ